MYRRIVALFSALGSKGGRNASSSLAHYKRGNLLKDGGQLQMALASYDQALALDPRNGNAFCNRGVVLQHLDRWDAALASYEQACGINPDDAVSHYNRGVLLRKMMRLQEALASFSRAIDISPDYGDALFNRGMLLQEQGQWNAALDDYGKAIASNPGFAEAHNNRAGALLHLKQFGNAVESYDRAIAIKPNIRFAFGMRRHARMHLCDWANLDEDMQALAAEIALNTSVAPPFTLLPLFDSPPLHHRTALTWVRDYNPANHLPPKFSRGVVSGRIRVGYFSADFCDHPVAILAAEFLEVRDRSKYEVIAFSFGPDTKDAMRKRLERTFDQFFDVRDKSDQDIALLSRNLGIDIAVDLGGHTAGSRTGIFSLRAAPLQISFLGYPGTMGADYIDYIVGDATVIPGASKQHYSEKIIFLPDSFLPHDSGRAVAPHRFTREQLGLPPGGFVFCCFNNSYKIMPGTFEIWMKILHRVDHSVLWLSYNNAAAADNLRSEAQSRGVDPRRLIFADRIPLAADHLARLRTADLFLDTLPYNAHATALDALWSGLPVLTRIGESFAGRVAASLLNAIGLPELVTSTAAEYEDLAVQLAANPERLTEIKLKLAQNRLTTPLFDTARFTRNLEKAYEQAYGRHHANLAPDHIYVA